MQTDDLDSLFAAPPAGFIEERKRIVAALKSAGRKDVAKAVEKIPRPSLAVWTVNQIARRDPEVVRQLVGITERLKSSGGAEYGVAAAELRQVLEELRGEAAAVLAAAGHEDVGPHLVQRVIANLRAAAGNAAAGNAETRATLEQGRLVRDIEEQDVVSLFGSPMGAEPPAARGQAAPKPPKPDDTKTKADGKAAAEAKAQERARAKAIANAEREVKRLRDAAAAARKDAERAARAVAAARESLTAAETRLAADQADADAAAHALAQAEAELAHMSES